MELNWSVLTPIINAVDRKDESTSAHTARVALYTQALAEANDLDEASVTRLMHAALLHDIGKIDIPEAILRKPGRLTDDEFSIMRSHTILGHVKLIELGIEDETALHLVRSHHERIDGTGYPDGLKGDEIPIAARFFAVIDTFDAMTSKRPYRHDVGPAAAERALAELSAKSGTWYWPRAVERFTELYRSGGIGWILEHLNRGEAERDEGDAPGGRRSLSLRSDGTSRLPAERSGWPRGFLKRRADPLRACWAIRPAVPRPPPIPWSRADLHPDPNRRCRCPSGRGARAESRSA